MMPVIVKWMRTARLLFLPLIIVVSLTVGAGADDLDRALQDVRNRYQQGDYASAIPLAQRYLSGVRAQYGQDHVKSVNAQKNLAELQESRALVLEAMGRLPEATQSRLDALAVREQLPSQNQAEIAASLSVLGASYLMQNRYEDAQRVLLRALAIREKTLPANDPDIVATLKQLGDLFASQGRYQEAALYHRRVPPPPAPPLGAYRPHGDVAFRESQVLVFFATNRERNDVVRIGFGSTPGKARSVGYAIVDFARPEPASASPRNPDLIRMVSDKILTIADVRVLDERSILDEVRPRIEHSKTFKRQAFVFVHGFNVTFDNALRRTAQIAHDIGFDGPAFLYSWPSQGQLAQYTLDRKNASASIHDLREFLQFVVSKSGATTVHLIAHSMGNPLLLGALTEFRFDPGWADLHIGQVILASPDMPTSNFAAAVPVIKNAAAGITLYASSSDIALVVSEAVNRQGPRAGFVPASGPAIVEGVNTIDVTAASTAVLSLNHSTYAESPELLSEIGMLLHGVNTPDKLGAALRRVQTDRGIYWKVTAEK